MLFDLNNNTSPGFLNKIDPRVKIAGSILLLGAAFKISTWLALLPILVISIAAWAASGRSLNAGLREHWYFSLFYIITFLLHIALTKAEPYWHLPLGINLSRWGAERGGLFCIKIFSVISISGALLSTTHPTDWQRAVEALVPRKSKKLRHFAFITGMAIRFLPVVLTEAQRLQGAQQGRGWKLSGSLANRIKSLIPIALPLISALFYRAEILIMALRMRGFNLDNPRGIYKPLRFSRMDVLVMLVLVLTTALSLIL